MLRDILLVFKRNMLVTLRNPIFIIIGLFQPFCFLLFFAPLLKSIANFQGNHLAMFVPGMLVMLAFYGSAYVGFSLVDDWRVGYLERLWVTPISRTAIVLGRSLRDVLVVIFQSLILVLLSFVCGLEANLYGIGVTFGLVMLVSAALSSFSYMIALFFKEETAIAAMINLILLPVQLLSGITLPLTLAPYWIKTVAQFNPLAHTVDGARALFVGNFADSSVMMSFLIMTIIGFLALVALVRTYKSRAV